MNKIRSIIVLCILALLMGCSPKEYAPVELISAAPMSGQATDFPVYQQPTVVMRTSASEVQILTRLARTIDELEALVREAEMNADPDARIRFDYYQLRADILAISQGIQAHIQTPVYTPRILDPLVGNYGR